MVINLDERTIQGIRKIGQTYPIRKIVLFGSRARGDHKLTSDIDLAIFPLTELYSRGHIACEFEDMDTLLKIDTVFINESIDPNLIEIIQKEGVTLYERAGNKNL